ncbi:MAG TPA: hypothetical protein VHL31_17430 [Geminicoccus sp.]|jgi:hypothetical protein|uniref:hypothetical protein n=1 Tax=Geminicoccus sp. TaxID=2024832 RepID=UPI002E2ED770|nr:hypothetical protein [Geminicoccus sp.]HEX2528070.1 hypothetical protein [Geminicoccus sp.]
MQPVPVPAHVMPVYVWCMGQDDNIGDVVLRRRLLDELRPIGPLHVFLGDAASDDFVTALRLGSGDIVIRDSKAWTPAVLHAARQGPILCVGKPGELPTDTARLRRSLRRLLLHWQVGRKGGAVVQLGIGAREQPRRLMPLFRLSFRLHHMVRWRDPRSHAQFRLGSVMPDWGFDDFGPTSTPLPGDGRGPRELVVLSLRGDRPAPGQAWLEGVRAFCRRSALRPIVVTQVRRDADQSRHLARRLDAELVDWGAEPHAQQEQRLRRTYARAALAVSDRLHVLIVAFTEGAVPLCLVDRPEDKIGRHFEAIGYRDASIDVSGLPAERIAGQLEAALRRQDEAGGARTVAVNMIAEAGRDLRTLVASRGRPTR